MELKIYPLLGTPSKRAIRRKRRVWGKPYRYQPRQSLIYRLQEELGWSEEQIREQIAKEREFLISQYP